MSELAECKARRDLLRARRRALEEALSGASPAEQRRLRLELAGVREDLADCNARLRELAPNHRISHGKTWAGVDGSRWDRLQYETWAALESAQEPEGPTDRERMQAALSKAVGKLTPKQGAYLAAAGTGRAAAQVAREAGVDRSTVARTLRRARANLAREAGSAYALGRVEGRVDLSDPEQMAALLDRLTQRQQLYFLLYYGEWMSLREIGALLGVDHSTILRTLRRGLERLEEALGPGPVELSGLGELEDRLMAHYSGVSPENWLVGENEPAPKRQGKGTPGRRGPFWGNLLREGPWLFLRRDRGKGLLYRRLEGGTVSDRILAGEPAGRLRAWLEARRAQAEAVLGPAAPGRAVGRLLMALLKLVRIQNRLQH